MKSYMKLRLSYWLGLSVLFCNFFALSACASSKEAVIHALPVVTGLDHPWSMVFLPEGEILVTERSGQLRRIKDGQLDPKPVQGVPTTAVQGQGGLMGLALHPQFAQSRWLYFSFVGEDENGYSTSLARGQYRNGQLSQVEVLFAATPRVQGGQHFGGRIVFDRQGKLYLGLGDRGQGELAQQLSNTAGSVIRLNEDGSIPADNPFVNKAQASPEIYSYGHRNIQGLALNPLNGQIWAHEHGPQGGDELNRIKAGVNYGWPVITYGEEYGGGAIGEGEVKAGMEQPLYHWTPSIAPSGMTFYTGQHYPGWQGNLLIGSLKFELVVRLSLGANGEWQEEHLLENKIGRIRDVQQGLDGFVYVLTDESDGGLYRLIYSQ